MVGNQIASSDEKKRESKGNKSTINNLIVFKNLQSMSLKNSLNSYRSWKSQIQIFLTKSADACILSNVLGPFFEAWYFKTLVANLILAKESNEWSVDVSKLKLLSSIRLNDPRPKIENRNENFHRRVCERRRYRKLLCYSRARPFCFLNSRAPLLF